MLNNWLSPIPKEDQVFLTHLSKNQLGRNIAVFIDQFPDLQKVDLALIGISHHNARKVRESLYELNFPFNTLRIADIGNLRKEDTSFLIPVLKELLESNITPILIGDDPQYSYAQFRAYNELKRATNMVFIDQKVEFSTSNTDKSKYLNAIITANSSNLFNLGILGLQSHFTDESIIQMLDTNNFDHLRLGRLKGSLHEAEPFIRDADALCFNLNALKQTEAPGSTIPTPSGFFSEEACALTRYAGISDKLTSIGFYGFDCQKDINDQTAQVIGQMIWYFLDGYYNRMGDFPVSMNDLVEYIVHFKNVEAPMTFWKSTKSGRWWMQVPVKTKKKHQRHQLIPCSYNDYQMACQDNVPERLLYAFKRFS